MPSRLVISPFSPSPWLSLAASARSARPLDAPLASLTLLLDTHAAPVHPRRSRAPHLRGTGARSARAVGRRRRQRQRQREDHSSAPTLDGARPQQRRLRSAAGPGRRSLRGVPARSSSWTGRRLRDALGLREQMGHARSRCAAELRSRLLCGHAPLLVRLTA